MCVVHVYQSGLSYLALYQIELSENLNSRGTPMAITIV